MGRSFAGIKTAPAVTIVSKGSVFNVPDHMSAKQQVAISSQVGIHVFMKGGVLLLYQSWSQTNMSTLAKIPSLLNSGEGRSSLSL